MRLYWWRRKTSEEITRLLFGDRRAPLLYDAWHHYLDDISKYQRMFLLRLLPWDGEVFVVSWWIEAIPFPGLSRAWESLIFLFFRKKKCLEWRTRRKSCTKNVRLDGVKWTEAFMFFFVYEDSDLPFLADCWLFF